METKNYFAWVVLLLGIASWVGVYYFWSTTQEGISDFARTAQGKEQVSNISEQNAKIHTAYQGSIEDRKALQDIMALDPIKIANLIYIDVANSNSVIIKLSNPTTENVAAGTKEAPVQVFGFVASASGTFAEVSKALRVLERLPLAVSIDTVDISVDPIQDKKSTGTLWHLNAYLRVYTTNDQS